MSVEAAERQRVGRSPVVDVALAVVAPAVVAFLAAAFAHYFREALFWVAEQITDEHGAVSVARHSNRFVLFLVVTASLIVAAVLGRAAARWRGERLGMSAVARAIRGEGPGPSFRATSMRTGATWIATVSTASIGRESAIMEFGAAMGTVGDRITRRKGSALATTGIASAFAAAYHAPIAAVMYVEEHLGVRNDRRTAIHTVAGAGLGFLTATWLLGAKAVLPHSSEPWDSTVVVLLLLGLVPAYLASRVFRWLRERLLAIPTARPRWRWPATVVLAVAAAVMVASVPLTAGNGLEAIREAAVKTTFALALALVLGKLVATALSVGSGAPGGVVAPSMAVAGGAALMMNVALRGLGVDLGSASWDAMLILMGVGIAVSVQAPLMGVFMAPEMAGDLKLVPLSAAVAGGVWAIDWAVARIENLARGPVEVQDEDA